MYVGVDSVQESRREDEGEVEEVSRLVIIFTETATLLTSAQQERFPSMSDPGN